MRLLFCYVILFSFARSFTSKHLLLPLSLSGRLLLHKGLRVVSSNEPDIVFGTFQCSSSVTISVRQDGKVINIITKTCPCNKQRFFLL